MKSHPSRVRELKLNLRRNKLILQMSHPSRVRELKLKEAKLSLAFFTSHPSRVRELKLDIPEQFVSDYRRTPPGCVN